jgi:hypothetical protein
MTQDDFAEAIRRLAGYYEDEGGLDRETLRAWSRSRLRRCASATTEGGDPGNRRGAPVDRARPVAGRAAGAVPGRADDSMAGKRRRQEQPGPAACGHGGAY